MNKLALTAAVLACTVTLVASPAHAQPMMGPGGGPGGPGYGWGPGMMMGPGMMGWDGGRGGMGMLCDPSGAGLAEWRMQRIEQEATRMGALVDDLLLLSRLDEGRPLGRELVDLQALAADAVTDARAVEPGRRIGLDSPEPVLTLGDHDRLLQALGKYVQHLKDLAVKPAAE